MHSILFPLGLTIMLAVVPFIHASSSASQPVVHRDNTLFSGWTEFGCWTDDPSRPTLTSIGYIDSIGMTIENCISACISTQTSIAGLEQGTDCHCGDSLTSGSTLVQTTECNTPCSGNSAENCGGPNRLHMFYNGTGSPPPTLVQKVNQWELKGCYNDSNDARALSQQVAVDIDSNSAEICTSACQSASYSLAGMENADECYCDNTIQNGAHIVDPSLCALACTGNGGEYCGAASFLAVYAFVGS